MHLPTPLQAFFSPIGTKKLPVSHCQRFIFFLLQACPARKFFLVIFFVYYKLVSLQRYILEMCAMCQKRAKEMRKNLVNPNFCVNTHTHTHTHTHTIILLMCKTSAAMHGIAGGQIYSTALCSHPAAQGFVVSNNQKPKT